MFKNKMIISGESRNNIAGINVARLRKEKDLSQNDLAVKLQNIGHDIHKNGIQQMESGLRFITDIELIALAKVLETSVSELLKYNDNVSFQNNLSHFSRD